jgi:hypothetical protein
MNEYRIICDESHLIKTLSRSRHQKKSYPWFVVLKVVCGLGLAALIALMITVSFTSSRNNPTGLWLAALVPAGFLALLLAGPRLDYFLFKRRLRKSPYYGSEMLISVSEDGIASKTPLSQGAVAWPAMTRATRLSDGFLLESGPGVLYWWPDSALVAGSISDVTRLLRANISSYADRGVAA